MLNPPPATTALVGIIVIATRRLLSINVGVNVESRWCEHIIKKPENSFWTPQHYFIQNSIERGWHFCPICGTPRPKAKTLEEKFREVFDKRNVKYMDFGTDCQQPLESQLVRLATEHFNQKEKV